MRYVATGRVHPERADINFSRIEWHIPNEGKVFAQCDSSQITIVLELTTIDGWATAFLAAEHFALIIVGALGFSLGTGYSVELIQITEEHGEPHVLGVRPHDPNSIETLMFAPHDPIFNRAFQLSNKNIFFRLALRDFLRAITDAIDCPTHCYRSIESIKSAFASKEGVDNWEAMHNAIGTDRLSIETTIKSYADPIRHGNWVNARPTDSTTRWQMLLLTRNILLKFLDHELPAS